MEKDKTFWIRVIIGIFLFFGALGIAYLYGLTPCKIAIGLNPQIEFCQPMFQTFSGTWQGTDPYDGSVTTISLFQTGQELVGTYDDSFTLNVDPPGYHDKGSGTILSPTTAQIIFDLSRWDGHTYKYELHFVLSNQNNTLLMNTCLLNDEIDILGCPMVLQKK